MRSVCEDLEGPYHNNHIKHISVNTQRQRAGNRKSVCKGNETKVVVSQIQTIVMSLMTFYSSQFLPFVSKHLKCVPTVNILSSSKFYIIVSN